MLSPQEPGFLPYISIMHPRSWWPLLAGLGACDVSESAATLDASIDEADASIDALSTTADAPLDAPSDPTASWARYSIAPGAHTATVTQGPAGNPRAGFVNGIA
ncbi:MAG: hypothetical protein H0V17_32665, partial [Deltaproteobacteria bacterium]|nr:hypothetical protein [Deltaproteobacteria bacterium]